MVKDRKKGFLTQKEKILIVEDESIVAAALKLILRKLGYSVAGIVDTSREAIKMAKKVRPDLILMDIVLKGRGDGIETAKTIFEEIKCPIIYLTAYADKTTLNRAVNTGPFGYLLKPYREEQLESTIQVALAKARNESIVEVNKSWFVNILESIPTPIFCHR